MQSVYLLDRTYELLTEMAQEQNEPMMALLHQLVQEEYDRRRWPKTLPAVCIAVGCPHRRI